MEEWNFGEVSNNIRTNINHSQIGTDTPYLGLEHLPRKSLAVYEVGSSGNLGSNKFKLNENDILFGKLRPYFHKVVFAPFSGVCSTDILVIRPVQREYYGFCLLHYFSEDLVEYSNQFSVGTRMPRVNWIAFLSMI
jgi:type I restriction enzyme S subunit